MRHERVEGGATGRDVPMQLQTVGPPGSAKKSCCHQQGCIVGICRDRPALLAALCHVSRDGAYHGRHNQCLESLPAFLFSSSQSPSGPAGGAHSRRLRAGARSYWTARCDIGRTGPGGATCPHGTGRRRIDCSGPGGASLSARDWAAPDRRCDRRS